MIVTKQFVTTKLTNASLSTQLQYEEQDLQLYFKKIKMKICGWIAKYNI